MNIFQMDMFLPFAIKKKFKGFLETTFSVTHSYG